MSDHFCTAHGQSTSYRVTPRSVISRSPTVHLGWSLLFLKSVGIVWNRRAVSMRSRSYFCRKGMLLVIPSVLDQSKNLTMSYCILGAIGRHWKSWSTPNELDVRRLLHTANVQNKKVVLVCHPDILCADQGNYRLWTDGKHTLSEESKRVIKSSKTFPSSNLWILL